MQTISAVQTEIAILKAHLKQSQSTEKALKLELSKLQQKLYAQSGLSESIRAQIHILDRQLSTLDGRWIEIRPKKERRKPTPRKTKSDTSLSSLKKLLLGLPEDRKNQILKELNLLT